MIIEHYKALKQAPPVKTPYQPVPKQLQQSWPLGTAMRPTEPDRAKALQFNIDPDEFVRRDKIVRQLYLNCNLHIGERVRPAHDTDFEKYGEVAIKKIFKSYFDFPTVEAIDWPDDDDPYIITVSPSKGDSELLVVTSSYLRRFKMGEKC